MLQNFGENVNFGNFQKKCRVNAEIRVFVATYPYKILVLFHTFFFTFGKDTDSQNFKYKEYSVNGAKLILSYVLYLRSTEDIDSPWALCLRHM